MNMIQKNKYVLIENLPFAKKGDICFLDTKDGRWTWEEDNTALPAEIHPPTNKTFKKWTKNNSLNIFKNKVRQFLMNITMNLSL